MTHHVLIAHDGEDDVRRRVLEQYPTLDEYGRIYTVDREYMVARLMEEPSEISVLVLTRQAAGSVSRTLYKRLKRLGLLPHRTLLVED